MLSSPAPAVIVSLPAPPMIVSLLAPPVIASLPTPPMILNFPPSISADPSQIRLLVNMFKPEPSTVSVWPASTSRSTVVTAVVTEPNASLKTIVSTLLTLSKSFVALLLSMKMRESAPSPPTTVSAEVRFPEKSIISSSAPPSMLSAPTPAVITSVPAPPTRVSLHAPPVIESKPAPPVILKLPSSSADPSQTKELKEDSAVALTVSVRPAVTRPSSTLIVVSASPNMIVSIPVTCSRSSAA